MPVVQGEVAGISKSPYRASTGGRTGHSGTPPSARSKPGLPCRPSGDTVCGASASSNRSHRRTCPRSDRQAPGPMTRRAAAMGSIPLATIASVWDWRSGAADPARTWIATSRSNHLVRRSASASRRLGISGRVRSARDGPHTPNVEPGSVLGRSRPAVVAVVCVVAHRAAGAKAALSRPSCAGGRRTRQ